MVFGADLSFLDKPGRLGSSDFEYEQESSCGLQTSSRLCSSIVEDFDFELAPVEQPGKFLESIKDSAPGLTDFRKGTTTVGFLIDDGIIIAVDSRASMGAYMGSDTVRKVIEINDRLLGTMAGGAADCMFWERHLGKLCRMYELRNKEEISVAAASNLLANIFFQYKGAGLSCGTMVAGYDKKGPQLYYVDDNGTRLKGKVFSLGSGSTYAYSVVDAGLKSGMTTAEAVELGRRAIYQATHRDAGSGGFARVYHVHKDGWTNVIDGEDVNELHYKYATEKGMVGDEM